MRRSGPPSFIPPAVWAPMSPGVTAWWNRSCSSCWKGSPLLSICLWHHRPPAFMAVSGAVAAGYGYQCPHGREAESHTAAGAEQLPGGSNRAGRASCTNSDFYAM